MNGHMPLESLLEDVCNAVPMHETAALVQCRFYINSQKGSVDALVTQNTSEGDLQGIRRQPRG